jgi:Ran GTPase-activating protein (RanGAP) involved in mRNA processing and transport
MMTSAVGKKQGLLHAQGSLAIDTKKRFQTFYFVLDFATLWYYNKEHLPEDQDDPLDIIVLTHIELDPHAPKEPNHTFVFQIKHKLQKKWRIVFSADSEQERQQWLKAFSEAINLANPQIFETTINDACLKANQHVPIVMEKIIEELKNKLDTEGLFRIPGQQTEIQKLKEAFDRGDVVDLKDRDPHLLTGTLKLYLRGLSDPLIPVAFYDRFVQISQNSGGKEAMVPKIRDAVKELPKTIRLSLGYMMAFLKEVTKHTNKNKMEATNLALSIAPTLFRKVDSKEDSSAKSMARAASDDLTSMSSANTVVETMIQYYDQIFSVDELKQIKDPVRDPEIEKSKKRVSLTQAEKSNITPTLEQHHEEWDKVLCLRINQKNSKSQILEEKICVIGQHRIYFFLPGGKFEFDAHFIDLISLNSPNRTKVKLEFKASGNDPKAKTLEVQLHPISYATFDVDFLIQYICQQYQNLFFGMPKDLKFKLIVGPESRKQQIQNGIAPPDTDSGCGGFVRTYRTLCDYYNIPCQENVAWDLENLFFNNDIKVFNLSEFIPNATKYPNPEFVTLILSLQYNKWFQVLNCAGQKLGNEGVALIANVLKTNQGLEVLNLKNVGATKEGIVQLCEACQQNSELHLVDIDLSDNIMEDKGAQALADFFARYQQPLSSLDVSNCQIGKKGMIALLEAMQKNATICANLQRLSLANNKFDSESSRKLGLFLGKAHTLKELDISGSQPEFKYIIVSLEKCQTINILNVSGNKVTQGDGKKQDQKDFVHFLNQLPNLQHVIVSNTNITADSLIEVLKNNKNLKILDISDNDHLGDEGLLAICNYLTSEKTTSNLRELTMNRLFTRRTKDRQSAINSISALIDKSKIEKLRITGGAKSQLKQDIIPFVLQLMNNKTLKLLDISSHGVGDTLAIALAKVIQHNKSLETLFWDENDITYNGLKLFKIGLERNKTIKKMPLPLLDLANIIKNEHASHNPQASSNLNEIVKLANEIQQLVFDNALNISTVDNATLRRAPSRIMAEAGPGDEGLNWSIGSARQHSATVSNSQGQLVKTPSASNVPSPAASGDSKSGVRAAYAKRGTLSASTSDVKSAASPKPTRASQSIKKTEEKRDIDTKSLTRASLLINNLMEALDANQTELAEQEKEDFKNLLKGISSSTLLATASNPSESSSNNSNNTPTSATSSASPPLGTAAAVSTTGPSSQKEKDK